LGMQRPGIGSRTGGARHAGVVRQHRGEETTNGGRHRGKGESLFKRGQTGGACPAVATAELFPHGWRRPGPGPWEEEDTDFFIPPVRPAPSGNIM
jgi:hypothetical protein